MDGEGFLCGCRYLLHDREAKFCAALDGILAALGMKAVKLPPQSPHRNAHWERWHCSGKAEGRLNMLRLGEASLRQALSHYVAPFHTERNHQAMGNVIRFAPPADRIGQCSGKIRTRERLGGFLKFYYRAAAGAF